MGRAFAVGDGREPPQGHHLLPALAQERAHGGRSGRRRIRLGEPMCLPRLLERAIEPYLSAAQNHQSIAGILDAGDDVGGKQGGRTFRADRIQQDLDELASGERVQVRERLVQQQHLGPRPEGHRKPQLRRLTAGERVGPLVERNAELFEAPPGVACVEARMQAARHRQVVLDAQATIDRGRLRHVPDPPQSLAAVLPRVHSVDLDSAGVRPLEGHADADERRLARPVRTDESRHASGRDREVDGIERDLPAEALTKAVCRQRGRADRSPRIPCHASPPLNADSWRRRRDRSCVSRNGSIPRGSRNGAKTRDGPGPQAVGGSPGRESQPGVVVETGRPQLLAIRACRDSKLALPARRIGA